MGETFRDSEGWSYEPHPDGDYKIYGEEYLGPFRRIGGGGGGGGDNGCGCCSCYLIFVFIIVPLFQIGVTTYYRLISPWNTRIATSRVGSYAGERLVENINGVEFAFRWCPSGEFEMGENTTDSDVIRPKRKITLTKGFWMSETEITEKQWNAVWGGKFKLKRKNGDDFPVNGMLWRYCKAFCQKTGTRLPTEAQWEYACRAGTTGKFAGDVDMMAWHRDNSDYKCHEVARKKPNPWGLYDMHGNIAEWCTDYSFQYPTQTIDPERTRLSILKERVPWWRRIFCYLNSFIWCDHVFRGGYYYDPPACCRSSFRGIRTTFTWMFWEHEPANDAGFRVILVPKQ